ncbi:MAG: radical SAM protein [Deltaproteobacteria bacterium]|jgi:radical SAM protein with 4Fe4S-binding SPASM domain|nr:radical SAM protein [Deltaproteobacteria bacterium]
MIGVSKLYCGVVEPSDLLRYRRLSAELPSHLLQFSEDKKPVIAWNITRACNLSCIHCYASATAEPAEDELNRQETLALVQDLADFGVPVILFSGGEPLFHPNIFELVELAVKNGTRAVLSTNGLLLTDKRAQRLREIGLSYVGISLDGLEDRHDHMRGRVGAFKLAMKAIDTAKRAKLKVGLRLTITKSNQEDIGQIFDLLEDEGIPRICFYHLVDNGLRPELAAETLTLEETRKAVDLIAHRTRLLYQKGLRPEVLTVDNPADGPYLYLKLRQEGLFREADNVLELLRLNGGSSSGHGVGSISWNGLVYPDQFWRTRVLGSIREKSFEAIWHDSSNDLLMKLKDKKSHVTGRCRECSFLEMCGGGLRARADFATNDPWAPDPACYLTDEEISLNNGSILAAEM